ncbi:MAG: sugar phosphate nucleotidyltransferase [Candidatus Hydrothermia bacterium]
MKFIACILSGGKGERFWPLSSDNNPKQFLPIMGEKSLIEETFDRLRKINATEEVFFVSNLKFEKRLNDMFPGVFKILEPVGKNTAPACAVANEYVLRKYGDAILGVFPSDHYIGDMNRFEDTIEMAKKIALDGYIVTVGIAPDRIETGYGYIERGDPIDSRCFKVRRFREKPDTQTAEHYISTGDFYWNAGMFIWHVATFDTALKNYLPEVYRVLKMCRIPEDLPMFYEQVPEISVDYAIMEKASNIAVIEGSFIWEDLGSFSSLTKVLTVNEDGNIINGTMMVFENCKDSIFIQEGPLIAAYGLEGVIVVSTKDVVLVIPKSEAQKVKRLREILKERNLTEFL